jgi:membrane protease YdiL (CAAX protease family)
VTEITSTHTQKHPAVKVSGRRLLAALGIGFGAGAVVGTITYYAIHLLAPAANSAVTNQLIVVEVYALLTGALGVAFRPVQREPLGLRFTSVRDLGLAFAAWLGIVAISALVYLLFQPVAGRLTDSLRKILSVATDVKRLEGQPLAAWAIAIPRGCLLVPLFEEVFFRGALLQWLRGYWSDHLAIIASAVLFAGMHGYPIVMPYAFIFGAFTGWIRIRTGSTLNTAFMHAMNNVFFLSLGFLLLR